MDLSRPEMFFAKVLNCSEVDKVVDNVKARQIPKLSGMSLAAVGLFSNFGTKIRKGDLSTSVYNSSTLEYRQTVCWEERTKCKTYSSRRRAQNKGKRIAR